jgi:uncharacterized protein YbaP (TraB family)
MKRKTSVFVIILILVGLISPCLSMRPVFCETGKSFLWKAKSTSTTVYLLGSIHFLKKEFYPLHETVESAYDTSDTLVVEANVNDVGKLDLTTLMDKALYKDDDRLEKHVSSETYELIKQKTRSLGIPPELAEKQKPWLLALSLETLELTKLGYDPMHGVDYYFLSKARGKRRILELESLDEQITLLSGFSDREQEIFLLSTLKNLESMASQLDILVQAWASGDTETVESVLTKGQREDGTIERIREKLLDERNTRMCSKIEDYLNSGGSYFVVVGAGHLVGKAGIVELLRAKGYSVEQL